MMFLIWVLSPPSESLEYGQYSELNLILLSVLSKLLLGKGSIQLMMPTIPMAVSLDDFFTGILLNCGTCWWGRPSAN